MASCTPRGTNKAKPETSEFPENTATAESFALFDSVTTCQARDRTSENAKKYISLVTTRVRFRVWGLELLCGSFRKFENLIWGTLY